MIGKKTKTLSIKLIVNLCFLIFFPLLSQAADVTLTIGDGSGFLGSTGNPVEVSLDNPNDKVKGVQMDVCDVDDYLTPIPNDPDNYIFACVPSERTTHFSCKINEQEDGCVTILLWSAEMDEQGDPYLIKKGSGAIFTIKYDVSKDAPPGECRDLNPKNIKVSDKLGNLLEATSEKGEFCFFNCSSNQDCDDGLYCNGEETCVSGVCQPGTDPCPGQTCNEDTDSCETITTTTTTPTTTTTASTTTTMITPSYKVSISPSSATLDSGATLQFTAKTTYGGKEVDGNYTWIVPGSTIWSTIDENGLFTAGENNTDSDIKETVKVTDTDHGNEFATAAVTIKVKEEPPPKCEVRINPSSATISSGDTLTLTANTIGEECEPGVYEWSIDTQIASKINPEEGNYTDYTAGVNNTGSQVTDIITVVDHANSDINGTATIYVESEDAGRIVFVFPDTLLGSRWIPLPYFLLIIGEDTNFNLRSTISFESEYILNLPPLGFGDILIALVLLKNKPTEGTVNFTISTNGENVTGEITIELLPLPFSEDYSDYEESYREISFDIPTLSQEHSVRENPL